VNDTTKSKKNKTQISKFVLKNFNEEQDLTELDYRQFLNASICNKLEEEIFTKGDTKENIELLIDFIKELWATGKLDVYKKIAIADFKSKYGISDISVQAADILVRKEFGIFNTPRNCPVKLEITSALEEHPVYENETGVLQFILKNISNKKIKQVYIAIESDLFKKLTSYQITDFGVAEKKNISFQYPPVKQTGSLLINIKVVITESNGNTRAYINDLPLIIKILNNSKHLKPPTMKIRAASSAVVNVDEIPFEYFEKINNFDIEVSKGAVVNFETIKKFLPVEKEKFSKPNPKHILLIYDDSLTQKVSAQIETKELKQSASNTFNESIILKLKYKDVKKKIYLFSNHKIIFGRTINNADVPIQISDNEFSNQSISRSHFSVQYDGIDFFVVDENSTGGTIINQEYIVSNEQAKITDNAVISILNGLLKFKCSIRYALKPDNRHRHDKNNEPINRKKIHIRNLKINRYNSVFFDKTEEYFFVVDNIRIGSSPDMDIVINSDKVDELNAHIFYNEHNYYIENLSSEKNVFLDDKLILYAETIMLTPKSIIKIGDAELYLLPTNYKQINH
jgi:pSer/pThr/pTyr-binding forkhead associated (FHA) protein